MKGKWSDLWGVQSWRFLQSTSHRWHQLPLSWDVLYLWALSLARSHWETTLIVRLWSVTPPPNPKTAHLWAGQSKHYVARLPEVWCSLGWCCAVPGRHSKGHGESCQKSLQLLVNSPSLQQARLVAWALTGDTWTSNSSSSVMGRGPEAEIPLMLTSVL